jgi:hypothetical protein
MDKETSANVLIVVKIYHDKERILDTNITKMVYNLEREMTEFQHHQGTGNPAAVQAKESDAAVVVHLCTIPMEEVGTGFCCADAGRVMMVCGSAMFCSLFFSATPPFLSLEFHTHSFSALQVYLKKTLYTNAMAPRSKTHLLLKRRDK